MVKKLKADGKDEDKLFADAVRMSARQIWQAGLGAFAQAQKESEGDDRRAFHALVQEGTAMQQPGALAAASSDKLERVFEERVGRALGAIGVPTRDDVAALARQVEQLARMVEQLSGGPALLQPASNAKRTPAATVEKVAAKVAAPRKPATEP